MNSLAESMLFLSIVMLPGAAFTVISFLLEKIANKQMMRAEYNKSLQSLQLSKKAIYVSGGLFLLGLYTWAIVSMN